MRGLAEGSLFLIGAAGLHLMGLSALSLPSGDTGSAGDHGTATITLAAANASLQTLVQQWDQPPDAAPSVTAPQLLQPELPALPSPVAMPLAAATPLAGPAPLIPAPKADTPSLDTSPAIPRPVTKPTPTPLPAPKAKPQPTPPASDSRAKQTATGEAKTTPPGLSNAKQRSLTAQWGAQILRRIERKKSFPAAARGRTGVVGLRLTVTRQGKLQAVTVTRSAGLSALDNGALTAVKRARQFPAAPKGLSAPQYTFNLSIRFDG